MLLAHVTRRNQTQPRTRSNSGTFECVDKHFVHPSTRKNARSETSVVPLTISFSCAFFRVASAAAASASALAAAAPLVSLDA